MEYLYERLKLTDEQLLSEVTDVIKAFFKPFERQYNDNSAFYIQSHPDNPTDYNSGLKLLSNYKIITYIVRKDRESELVYWIQIVNRYNLETLYRELEVLRRNPKRLKVERKPVLPRLPNMAFYELRTGKIIINGKVNTLRKTNKRLFDALFIAYPDYADRDELLKIVGASKRDVSSKIALNEAFSNLRNACGVTAKIIGVSSQGSKLNARSYPLSTQLL